ncbi:hypothetical protein N665_0224s0019 [Sinapis alba]|nr:hypothetical protein N665_0224s0019 [Sinapis alba]
MVKMEKQNNLQVTFSKRKNGLFKKASELCTLCDARIVVIVFSPSGKVYSFGHTKVETIINRFENNDHPHNNPQPNMQLGEIHQNSEIRYMNNRLTEVTNKLESEQKTSEELKKLREKSKRPEIWSKESIGGLDLGQAKEFKGKLENLKKQVTHQAFNIFLETTFPHRGFYGGSSSNAPFGINGGINIDPNLNPFEQRRMVNVNADYHNMVLPNHPSRFGNYSHVEGFVHRFNHNMAIPNHPNPNESGNEHPQDGRPPQPRSD